MMLFMLALASAQDPLAVSAPRAGGAGAVAATAANQERQPEIIVRWPVPHMPRLQWPAPGYWRGGVPVSTTRIFDCAGRPVSVATRAVEGAGGWRTKVREVLIDGAPVAADVLASIDAALAGFGATPDITPQCLQEGVRLIITDAEVVTGSRTVTLGLR